MIKQQETYQITHIIKVFIKLLAFIYQNKQIQAFKQIQINFIGKLKVDGGATMFFIAKNYLKHLDLLNITK